jgi:hypothetical protein
VGEDLSRVGAPVRRTERSLVRRQDPERKHGEHAQIGDFLLVNKLMFGAEVPFHRIKRLPRLRDPQRGDVIVFEYPGDVTKHS